MTETGVGSGHIQSTLQNFLPAHSGQQYRLLGKAPRNSQLRNHVSSSCSTDLLRRTSGKQVVLQCLCLQVLHLWYGHSTYLLYRSTLEDKYSKFWAGQVIRVLDKHHNWAKEGGRKESSSAEFSFVKKIKYFPFLFTNFGTKDFLFPSIFFFILSAFLYLVNKDYCVVTNCTNTAKKERQHALTFKFFFL